MRLIPTYSIVLIFIAISILGATLAFFLPVSLIPIKKQAQIYISISYPEAKPLQVEKEVTALVEAQLAALSDIVNISSNSRYGEAVIQLDFLPSTDIDFKILEIRAKIQDLKKDLPSNISFPTINYISPNEEEKLWFLIYHVQSSMPNEELNELLLPQMRELFSMEKGLEKMELIGNDKKMLKILFKDNKIQKYGLDNKMIIERLRELAQNREVGVYQNSFQSFNLWLGQDGWDETFLNNLIVFNIQGREIYLKDIAFWKFESPNPQSYYRINGQEHLTLRFQSDNSTNRLVLAKKIKKKLSKLESSYEGEIRLIKKIDETEFIREELNKLFIRSTLALTLLILCLLIISRHISYSSILLFSIWVNLTISIIVFYLLGLGLNLYSLAGLSVSFGIVVDNSILMIDGLGKESQSSGKKFFLPILAATVTTLASLLSIFFLPKSIQDSLWDFCLTLAICLVVSLIVSGMFIPALCDLVGFNGSFIKTKKSEVSVFWINLFSSLKRKKKWIFLFILLIWGIPTYLLPIRIEGGSTFSRFYNQTLGSSIYQEKMRPLVDRNLGGTSRLFYFYVFNHLENVNPEGTKLFINPNHSQDLSIHLINDIILRLEEQIQLFDQGVESFETQVNSGRNGRIVISFKKGFEESSLPYLLKARLETLALEYSGISWNIYGVGKGFSSNPPGKSINLTLLLSGYNYPELDHLVNEIRDSLLDFPRIQDVYTARFNRSSPNSIKKWELNFKQEFLSLTAATPREVSTQIRSKSVNESPDLFIPWKTKERIRNLPVIIKEEGYDNKEIRDFENDLIMLDSVEVSLKSLVSIQQKTEVSEVRRQNQQYLRTIRYLYIGSENFGIKHRDQIVEKWNKKLPDGYHIQALDRNSNFHWGSGDNKYQARIIFLIIVLIYIICTVFFESFSASLLVISLIPVSYIGMFLTFYFFDIPFDIGGFASFLFLAGLTVNHSIFLIHLIRKEKQKSLESILKVIKGKFLPIILTTVTSCVGMLPFLLDRSPFWFSLAAGTIGGLILSTLLLFMLIPVFYQK